MTYREIMMFIHGVGLGSVFLMVFTAIALGLSSLRSEWISVEGIQYWTKKTKIFLWVMTAIAWATVITGLFFIAPWYYVRPPAGATDLSAYPRYLLLSNAATAQWNNFGMAWKEHVALLAPVAATVVAYVVQVYGEKIIRDPKIRRIMIEFFMIAFATAAIAGILGVFITRAAPIH